MLETDLSRLFLVRHTGFTHWLVGTNRGFLLDWISHQKDGTKE